MLCGGSGPSHGGRSLSILCKFLLAVMVAQMLAFISAIAQSTSVSVHELVTVYSVILSPHF